MSYAQDIENRVMFNNWTTQGKNVGQMRIQGIYEDHKRIGTEVIFRGNSRHTSTDGTTWWFRAYADGTAYCYPRYLNNLLGTTRRTLERLMEKYYRTVHTLRFEDQVNYVRRELQILKRKPCGELSRMYFNGVRTFNDFLVTRYNCPVTDNGDE